MADPSADHEPGPQRPGRAAESLAPLAVGVTCTLLGGLPVWLVASLAPQLRGDLDMDETGLGTAVGVTFLISAVTAVPAGRLVDRIGWRRGAAASLVLSASVLLAIGVLARSWVVLVVLLAVGALGVSLSHPAANTGISRVVPLRRQGLAFGIKQASIPLTTLVAGLSAPLVVHTAGWRAAFVGAAGIGLGFLLLLLATGRSDHGRQDRPAPPAGTVAQDRAPPVVSDRMGRWPLTVLASGAGLVAGATVSLGGFLVLFAVASGMEQDGAGYLLAAGSTAGIVSRIVTGYLADRCDWEHLTVVSLMMVGGAVGFAALAVGGSAWLLVVGTLLAFGLGWSWNGLFALAVVLRSPGAPGWATGVIQTAIGLGATAGPALFGLTVTRLSYTAAWSGAAATTLCGAALILLGLRMDAHSSAPLDGAGR